MQKLGTLRFQVKYYEIHRYIYGRNESLTSDLEISLSILKQMDQKLADAEKDNDKLGCVMDNANVLASYLSAMQKNLSDLQARLFYHEMRK